MRLLGHVPAPGEYALSVEPPSEPANGDRDGDGFSSAVLRHSVDVHQVDDVGPHPFAEHRRSNDRDGVAFPGNFTPPRLEVVSGAEHVAA